MAPQGFTTRDLGNLEDIKPSNWPDINSAFEWYLKSEFGMPMKFTIGGLMIAVGAIIFNQNSAWLAHIITHPEHRKKGLGTKMTKCLIDIAKSKDAETIQLLATDLGYPVYIKCGFLPEISYHHFINPGNFPEFKLNENVKPFSPVYWNELTELDHSVSGENRTHILKNGLEGALVFKKENKAKGFYLPKLGNGFIIAESPEAGIELMRCRLNREKIAMIPEANKTGIGFLRKQGYEETGVVWRLYYGKKPVWNPDQLYNRIGGNLG